MGNVIKRIDVNSSHWPPSYLDDLQNNKWKDGYTDTRLLGWTGSRSQCVLEYDLSMWKKQLTSYITQLKITSGRTGFANTLLIKAGRPQCHSVLRLPHIPAILVDTPTYLLHKKWKDALTDHKTKGRIHCPAWWVDFLWSWVSSSVNWRR